MRVMALDVGDVRIGVALTDATQTLAIPHTILTNDENIYINIEKIVEEKQVGKIIYGIPISLDGSAKRQVEKVEEFVSKLKSHISIELEGIDERFSTRTAHSIANQGKKRERRVDSIAASVILETYLDRERIRKKRQ